MKRFNASLLLRAFALLVSFACLKAAYAQIAPASPSLASQSASPQPALLPHPSEVMVVVGSPVPVPLAGSSSSVLVLPVEMQALTLATPVDLLRQDSSIFIEQRGAGGAQSDLVMRGGSFAQTLVLINGFRINDSQTTHHNLDLPIPLDAMDSIQILHGAGSTLYGADALSGVADFLTAAPSATSMRLRAGAGSFGASEASLLGGIARGRESLRITAARNSSSGFTADRDYRNQDASLESWSASRFGLTDLLFAASDRAFGANQFYGPYDSWERTKGWFTGARQELGVRGVAAFAYHRHSDEFVLLRDDPSAYENNHIDGSWQASLRRTFPLGSAVRDSLLLAGLEADGDSIHSNNLGNHARNHGAGFLDFDLRPAHSRWTVTAGVREELFSGGLESVLAPHLAASRRLPHDLKLRAGGGYGFRLPTYTDLYYWDPATVGNAHLKPESAWTADAGADWVPSRRLSVAVTGFYSRQQDAIDYVRSNSNFPWQAANLSGLHFGGVESALTWLPARSQSVHIAWTALHGAQDALHGLQSEYVLNYPVNNLYASWIAALGRSLTVCDTVQIVQRYRQTVYPVWNASVTRPAGRLHPYLRLDNLANTGYQEIAGVAMPGRSISGGVSFSLGR